jgi:HlyD family secretion protein
VDGVVLVKSADPGEVLAAGTTVVTVGDIEHPWLRGYINETDLGKVKLGSKARSPPIPTGQSLRRAGELHLFGSRVHAQADSDPEERVKLVYRIKIDLDNPKHELKSNMPADAEIVLN